MRPTSDRLPAWLLPVTGLAYANALVAGFQFDDFNVIVDNPGVHGLAAWWAGMPGIRPLLKLSYAANWQSGWGASGFHAINVLIHLLNVLLVWRLTALLPAPVTSDRDTARQVATLLFALHPIQTEAVTYISGRSMSLMASFALLGTLLWLSAPDRRRQVAALACLAAACLVKEVAIAVPLALLLLPQSRGRRGALLALVLLGLATMFLALGYQRLLSEPWPRGLAVNLLSESHALFYLLGQLLQPHRLNIDPDLPEIRQLTLLSGLPGIAILAAAYLAWRARRSRPWLSFGIGWCLILLAPTHSLLPRADLASERHLYLAGLGLYWLVGLAPLPRRPTLVAVLALAGMLLTFQRNQDYRDEVSLWEATTPLSPHKARVWNNLGYAYLLDGRPQEARAALETALRLDPEHTQARANLARLAAERPGSR